MSALRRYLRRAASWLIVLAPGICLLLLLGIGRAATSVVDPDGNPTVDFWSELWELGKAAGPFGTAIMGIMWWRADQERIKNRSDYDALVERVLPLIDRGVTAQERLGDVLTVPKRR